MPVPTPFHARTAALCQSYRWKDWAGHYAVCAYGPCHEPEYYAIRHAAGLLDVTPLFKYRITGKDAARLLAWVLCRDVTRLKPGRVAYSTWCDDRGHLLDDGTVTRLYDEEYRLTSAEPSYAWLCSQAGPYDVLIEDVTTEIAALALQGPTSREILRCCTDADLDALRFFGHTRARLEGRPVELTRTGYTGDLGYELWMANEDALAVWDALLSHGQAYGLLPIGLDALDMSRVEAGFVLQGIDYISARHALVDAQKSTPYELDLGFTVHLDREPFIGQAALRAEQARGPRWAFAGLVIDWCELEALYDAHGLPPGVSACAWRDARPVYSQGRQVGRATSGTFSPTLKQNLALATLDADQAAPGTQLEIEVTVEYQRRTVSAVVTEKPFFDPERKRA